MAAASPSCFVFKVAKMETSTPAAKHSFLEDVKTIEELFKLLKGVFRETVECFLGHVEINDAGVFDPFERVKNR